MGRLTWAPDTVDDLDRISAGLAATSPGFARAVPGQVHPLAASIAAQPFLGAVVPEYDDPDSRERLLHSYRVMYRVAGTDVRIVTVIHAARRLPRTPPG